MKEGRGEGILHELPALVTVPIGVEDKTPVVDAAEQHHSEDGRPSAVAVATAIASGMVSPAALAASNHWDSWVTGWDPLTFRPWHQSASSGVVGLFCLRSGNLQLTSKASWVVSWRRVASANPAGDRVRASLKSAWGSLRSHAVSRRRVRPTSGKAREIPDSGFDLISGHWSDDMERCPGHQSHDFTQRERRTLRTRGHRQWPGMDGKGRGRPGSDQPATSGEKLDGRFEVSDGAAGGTVLIWRVPISD